jgi:hypothetical protein
MKIQLCEPPMIDEIRKAFPRRPDGVVYAFGDTIYYPSGKECRLPTPIVEHERAHSRRQSGVGAEAWWRLYIEQPGFRYTEELHGHAREYLRQMTKDRNRNACLITSTVARMLAPFYEYGSAQPTMQKAIKDLRATIALEAAA